MTRRLLIIVLALVFVVSASACSSVDDEVKKDTKAIVAYEETVRPAPTGPYAVGQKDFVYTDETRSVKYEYDGKGINRITTVSPDGKYEQTLDPDNFDSKTNEFIEENLDYKNPPTYYPGIPYSWRFDETITEPESGFYRDVRVSVHYPTLRTNYKGLSQQFSDLLISYYKENGFASMGKSGGYTVKDAPIIETISQLHVVMLFHGLNQPTEVYQTYAEELASNGYIVVSVNLPFYGGPNESNTAKGMEAMCLEFGMSEGLMDENLDFAVYDPIFVLDTISEDPFFQKANFDDVVIIGHSFGTMLGSRVIEKDNRFKAEILLDGTFDYRLSQSEEGVDVPLLVLGGYAQEGMMEFYENSPYKEDNDESNQYSVMFEDAVHSSFEEVGLFEGPSPDPITYQTLVSARDMTHRWIDSYFKGDFAEFEQFMEQSYPDTICLESKEYIIKCFKAFSI